MKEREWLWKRVEAYPVTLKRQTARYRRKRAIIHIKIAMADYAVAWIDSYLAWIRPSRSSDLEQPPLIGPTK